MFKKTKRLAAVASVAVAGAAIALSGATAGAASVRALSLTGITPRMSPVVFNGKDLVSAAQGANGTLYAYEQVPGATTWRRQVIETRAQAGGVTVGSPSVTATATSVQVVAENGDGNIYFFQQTDGQTTWSAPQYVGTVTVGVPTDGIQQPEIAWTGVPGHTGTNSSITVADANGDILYWWQNGSTWEQETVASASSLNSYYQPDMTATSTGFVIVAAGTNGAFYSFYQPYGSPAWNSDGTLGVPSGAAYDAPYVTWDGTNVDVAATYYDGSGFTARFMWKSNSAEFWTEESLPGITDAQGVSYGSPAITWTPGHNLLISTVQDLSANKYRLDYWWQGSTFTNFNLEGVATADSPDDFITPALVNTGATSSGETVITAAYTTNLTSYALDDWTQPTGSPTWTKHQIQAP